MKRIVCAACFICMILLTVFGLYLENRPDNPGEPVYYRFSHKGLSLNVIAVRPDRILLTTVRQEGDIKAGGFCGINGGYFAMAGSAIPGPLCIAINDGVPVRAPGLRAGSADPYQNTGWYNAWGNAEGAATIVYDKLSGELKCLCVKSGYEIPAYVASAGSYWAQGGIDLALGNPGWLETMRQQGLTDYLETAVTYRSAMGFRDGTVYLFASENQSGLAAFRDAVASCLGVGPKPSTPEPAAASGSGLAAPARPDDARNKSASARHAILLDGYLCSQMLAVKKGGETFDGSRDCSLEEIIAVTGWNHAAVD